MKKKITTLLALLALVAGIQFIMAPSSSLIGQTYKILVRRGLKADLPALTAGELGFATDTRELYIGSSVGNIRVHGDYITPEMYGAKGDGVTDDTTAIQAALTAINASGGGLLLFAANKTYIIDTVTVYSNTTIMGADRESTIVKHKAPGSAQMFNVTSGATNVSFFNMKFDGDEANQGVATYSVCIRTTLARRTQIENCRFDNGGDRAIDIRGSTETYIRNCHFFECGILNPDANGGNAISVDVHLTTHSERVYVINCLFEKFGDTAIGCPSSDEIYIAGNFIYGMGYFGETPLITESGISVNGCKNAVVTGNNLYSVKYYGIIGIRLTAGGVNYEVENISITNNNLKTCGQPVRVGGSVTAFARNVIISKNIFDNCEDPVWLNNYIENITISDNIFYNMLEDPGRGLFDSDAALRLYECRYANVIGNSFYDDRVTAWTQNNVWIYGATYTDNINISNNIFQAATYPFAIDSGILTPTTKIMIGPNFGSDCYRMYGADIAAGNYGPQFITENGTIVKFDQAVDSTAGPTFDHTHITKDVLVAGATVGTNGVGVIGQKTGTAPTTSPADSFQQYSADAGAVAGQAGPHFRTEGGGIFGMRSDTGTTLQYVYQKDDLADDGTVTLPDATSGIVFVSCNAEAGMWLVQADGTVTKISGSTNTAAADTDGSLCVYDGGTGAIVKNRLGATGEIRIIYYYN